MGRFSGRTAVITGGGSGIGAMTAKRIASEGGTVILVGRTEAKLLQTANELKELEGKVLTFVADVTKQEQIDHLTTFVKESTETLHVLINNAGGSQGSPILEMTEENWDHAQNVNLKSVFLVSKALGKLMLETAKKEEEMVDFSIVNVASLSGHKAGAQIPHYSAAKAAVINFTRALAVELSPYIRVNSVSPGFVETPLTEDGLKNERFEASIKRNTALNRVGQAEEIANVISFAASPEASYMTGSDLLVDGGWLIV
ncbi:MULTISPECIES: SDR family NAD(P)-dependent oxidoreductase [Bacillales]|uniref:SDR family NAD(P)-dependent oxidoreductase n=1 Tax=Bacillales TaxID=1385 RepID=UPI001883FC52|nr:SDR family oxidoreductase [Pseudalkalibacillus hwajinpoensis]MBF0708866.1 SDR family oxidoreductase [Pseudalkalibacillus hwajinpoensis]WLR60127.1 SDR family oxidoreductase [Pseudalkalibacillus hwajinpoensis]